eukprot:6178566-Pleurochrysis_carterae.AAC.4
MLCMYIEIKSIAVQREMMTIMIMIVTIYSSCKIAAHPIWRLVRRGYNLLKSADMAESLITKTVEISSIVARVG